MKRHILKGLISALLALFGLSVFAAVAQATTYYVSPTGNDTAAGTSVTTPWKTFDRSWQSLYPGDTLIVMDGVYYQSLNPDTRNGEPGKPITIRAQHDGKAIIDGEHVRMTVKIGDTWPGPIGEYFVIEGIVARNSSDSVWFLRGDHNILRRVSGYNASTDTNDHVFLVWANDNLIEDCLCVWHWPQHDAHLSKASAIRSGAVSRPGRSGMDAISVGDMAKRQQSGNLQCK
ncbi:MAG: hypothetical protein IPK16_11370 [Anaerolineales bacterium]|nr:hypothetical protein [Anaerolineales bacterium]